MHHSWQRYFYDQSVMMHIKHSTFQKSTRLLRLKVNWDILVWWKWVSEEMWLLMWLVTWFSGATNLSWLLMVAPATTDQPPPVTSLVNYWNRGGPFPLSELVLAPPSSPPTRLPVYLLEGLIVSSICSNLKLFFMSIILVYVCVFMTFETVTGRHNAR